jgi:hypothetical protein
MTMRIFPDCFVGEIVYTIGRDGDLPLFDGPTPYGAFLLLTRNGLILALTGALGWALIRRVFQAEANSIAANSYCQNALEMSAVSTQ